MLHARVNEEADLRTMVALNEHSASRWLAHLHTTFTWVAGDSPDAILSIRGGDFINGKTKDQLGLDQLGLSRIRERSPVANRCSHRTAIADFGLKCLFEP